jgi:hypothetical protein
MSHIVGAMGSISSLRCIMVETGCGQRPLQE